MEPTGTVRIGNAAVLSTNLSRFGNLRTCFVSLDANSRLGGFFYPEEHRTVSAFPKKGVFE
jgi:hypothetical protein